MEMTEIIEDICTKPVVPLWPHAGKALGVCRAAIYAAAARNEIEVIRLRFGTGWGWTVRPERGPNGYRRADGEIVER